MDGDGCSAICTVESGWECTTPKCGSAPSECYATSAQRDSHQRLQQQNSGTPYTLFSAGEARLPSTYTYPFTYETKILTPVTGNGTNSTNGRAGAFKLLDVSDTMSSQDWRYAGGPVALPNGKIYFIPGSGREIGVLDAMTETFSVVNVSAKLGDESRKFTGAVLAPENRIFFIPFNVKEIGMMDTETGDFSLIPFDIEVPSSSPNLFWGGVMGPDGMIYMVPYNARVIGVLNPQTQAFSTIDVEESGNKKYSGGVLAPNGNIYFCPSQSDTVRSLLPLFVFTLWELVALFVSMLWELVALFVSMLWELVALLVSLLWELVALFVSMLWELVALQW